MDTNAHYEVDYSKLFRLSATICGVIVIGFLAFRFIAPFGKVVKYKFTPVAEQGKISPLNGVESSEQINTNAKVAFSIPKQIIRKNIVTFNLTLLSKELQGVWVRLQFKGAPKEVKLGVRADTTKKYIYKPLFNTLLNKIETEKVGGGLIFWQKKQTYRSFDEFTAKLPIDKKTATYYVDPGDIAMMKAEKKTVLDVPFSSDVKLRGNHTLFVRVESAPFHFLVSKQDLNMYIGEDSLSIELYKQDRLIAETTISDDGVSDTSKLNLLPQNGSFDIPKLEKGIYRILLKDNSKGGDIQITHIESNQTKVIFADSLFIIDTKPTKLQTTVKELTAQTFHPNSLQTLKLDGEIDLEIKKIADIYKFDLNITVDPKNTKKIIDNTKEIHSLMIPKNDLILSGKGYFSFTTAQMFDPTPLETVDVSTLKSMDNVDYIVANYTKAKKTGDSYETSVFFDPKLIERNGDKLYFSLEFPDMEKTGGEIELQNLEVTVEKPAWSP